MTTLTAKWNFPTTVLFGPGRIKELPAVLKVVMSIAFKGFKSGQIFSRKWKDFGRVRLP